MIRAASRLLMWMLSAAVALFALATIVLFVIAGTESGTRWVLARIASIPSIDIDTDHASGTLLSRLKVPSFRYYTSELSVEVNGIDTDISLTELLFRVVSVDRISAQAVVLRIATKDDPDDEREPFQLSMPALPVEIIVGELSAGSFTYTDTTVSDIEIRGAHLVNHRISAERTNGRLDRVSIQLNAWSADLHGDVNVSGDVSWQLADSPWSGNGSLGGSLSELQVSHHIDGDIEAAANGSIQVLNKVKPVVDLRIVSEPLTIKDWQIGRSDIHLAGTSSAYELGVKVSVVNQSGISAKVDSQSSGTLSGLHDMNATVETDIATVQVGGSLTWTPQFGVDVILTSENLDPSSLVPGTTGLINTRVHVTASSAELFSAEILALSGTWNGEPVVAGGGISRNAGLWRCADCDVVVGLNRVKLDGQLDGNLIETHINIDAPSLHQLWPEISGSLVGAGQMGGTLALPRFSGNAAGSAIVFGEYQFATVTARSTNSTPENVNFELSVEELRRSEQRLGNTTVSIQGTLDDSRITASWMLDDYSADVDLQVSIVGDTVSGVVLSASATEPYTGTWSLSDPFEFSASANATTIGKGVWMNNQAELIHNNISISGDNIHVDANLSQGPLAVLNVFMPERIKIQGMASAAVKIERVDGDWIGNVDWHQQDTAVVIRHGSEETYKIGFTLADASVVLADNTAKLRADLNSTTGFKASFDAELTGLTSDGQIQAQLKMTGDDWEFMHALVQDIENFAGEISADITATGSVSSPDLSGDLNWRNGQLAIPALNLPLSEINVTLTGSSAGDMTIAGTARSGGGIIRVGGSLNDIASRLPSFTARVNGERADLLNWPDYKLVASPDLAFDGDMDGVHLSGVVAIDKADISVRELPEGAVMPSDDVTVDGREVAERRQTRLTGEVTLELGSQSHINAFGLDTNLEGKLLFILAGDREPRAEGEVRLVGGFFEAYGQRLEIEKGTMVFTGPLDDPIINVRAVRRIQTADSVVTAGLNLTGRAQSLASSVFSDPVMPEADALSYLVLGRPIHEASAGEGSKLADTAYALGLRQAGLITNQIGQSVGLDELSVAGNNQTTTALVAGKQINSRLYARYAFGVFSKVGDLLLRYKISDSFSVEIGAGERQSMDILYIIRTD